jgi:hypothetical protein
MTCRRRAALADDDAEQRGLARAVGADDADDAARGQLEAQVVEQQLVAVGLAMPFASITLPPRRGRGGMLDRAPTPSAGFSP